MKIPDERLETLEKHEFIYLIRQQEERLEACYKEIQNLRRKTRSLFYYAFRFTGYLLCVAGWVLAKGFWSTFFAVICPPWAGYIAIEYALKFYGYIK